MSDPRVLAQREAMDRRYAAGTESRWTFHRTTDPLVRYLRDRRLSIALRMLERVCQIDASSHSVLLVCGGAGGEGSFFADRGFSEVMVSDISPSALAQCSGLDPRLRTMVVDAEAMTLPDGSFDFVLVQDGLHHLPRPALGLTEMVRVARLGVAVIEPHYGLAGKYLGREWEVNGDSTNYVFRWSKQSFVQTVKSYLVEEPGAIKVRRLWDHNLVVSRAVGWLPSPIRAPAAHGLYGALRPFNGLGNMFIGVVRIA